MAAPATTVRVAPAGRHLDDGHSTKLAFNRDSNASFWEKSVGIPGIDGGDPIDITTHHNTAWRTFAARALKTLTTFTVEAAYDPVIYSITDMRENLVNQEGSLTHTFPDGSTLDFFGFLQGWDGATHNEGEFPMVTLNITPTNFDPVNRVEAAPVLTSVSGT